MQREITLMSMSIWEKQETTFIFQHLEYLEFTINMSIKYVN